MNFCIRCGTKYGTFKQRNKGKVFERKKWVCDNCGYNQSAERRRVIWGDSLTPRRRSEKTMNRNPEKIRVLRTCGCRGIKKIRHHPNYNKPFEVELLCYGCHWLAHEKMEPGFNSNDKNGAMSRIRALNKERR